MNEKGCEALLLLLVVTTATAEECIKVDKCSCKTSSGFTVDLNKISPGQFTVEDSTSNYRYRLSLCAPLSPVCDTYVQASVCQEQKDTLQVVADTGDDSTQVFEGDPAASTLKVTYSSSDRKSILSLLCSGDTRLESQHEGPEKTYNFALYDPSFCIPSEDSGLSTGSILVILFFVFFAVYWIGGIIFMKFVRRAEGLEVIPNYEFWKELPLVIRDGVLFTFRGCKGESTYEKI